MFLVFGPQRVTGDHGRLHPQGGARYGCRVLRDVRVHHVAKAVVHRAGWVSPLAGVAWPVCNGGE